tara:strand:- start:1852 stop:3267 length:1416 start_codon:yes stop_codon:yes gene_type:complete
MTNLKGLCFTLWLCGSVFLSFSSKGVDCDTDTIGLCTPTIEEIIDEVITETIEHEADGITITTTTETTTTTTTVTNESSDDILDGDNDYVVTSKEGDMDYDWGGQGPASMRSGTYCGDLGSDKCAEITGSGNSTSTMGVSGMGTTFIQTVNISDLDFDKGGRTNYTIKVEKRDAQDSIYMHITGKNGNTNVFSGTDVLSASGTASGYQAYEGGWDFSGSLTTIIVEVGGRDINLAVGPLFDDVTVQVLYNVVNTIVTQSITSVEQFIALNIDAPEEVIDVVEDIFDSNEMVETDTGYELEPIELEEPSYESIEIEIEEIEVAEIEMEVEVEEEIEAEIEIESDSETSVEPSVEAEDSSEQEEIQQEETKEEPKSVAKASSKEKAAKKIMKKIDDKKRYDNVSQTKTLVVMQVLGNTKTFFESQQSLVDREGFFSNVTLPDTVISDNDMASYFLFVGSDGLMNDMIDSQWQN